MNFLTTTTESYISLFFTLALMLVLLYFMIYRPQKKQEKYLKITKNRRFFLIYCILYSLSDCWQEP